MRLNFEHMQLCAKYLEVYVCKEVTLRLHEVEKFSTRSHVLADCRSNVHGKPQVSITILRIELSCALADSDCH